MATCRATVNTALRKLGRLAAGREPRQADAQDALDALRGLYTAWVSSGAFGRLCDVVPTGTSYTATGNERVFRTKGVDALSVNLPELVADGWVNDFGRDAPYYGTTVTISDDGDTTTVTVAPSQPLGYCKPPRDGAVVSISDAVCGQTKSYLYDGTIKKWQGLDDLALDAEAPRSSADPQGLAACLAVEIADQFGVEVMPATLAQASRFKSAMVNRFSMPRQMVPGVYY